MQLKSISQVRFLTTIYSSFIMLLAFSGCNDDVFMDRPELTISDISIGAGETTTITAGFDVNSYPEMTIYYAYGTDDEYLIYNGKAQSYSDELLRLDISVYPEEKCLKMEVGFNLYPQNITVKFQLQEKHNITATVGVLSPRIHDFRIANISYDLNSWENNVRWDLFELDKGTFHNSINETVAYPIIINGMECQQRGKFVPDIPVINDLLEKDFYDVPVVAINENGSPVLTNQTVTYGPYSDPDGFRIEEYPFIADKREGEMVKPGYTLSYTTHADCEIYRVKYYISLVNSSNNHVTIRGHLEIAVPRKLLYTYSITK